MLDKQVKLHLNFTIKSSFFNEIDYWTRIWRWLSSALYKAQDNHRPVTTPCPTGHDPTVRPNANPNLFTLPLWGPWTLGCPGAPPLLPMPSYGPGHRQKIGRFRRSPPVRIRPLRTPHPFLRNWTTKRYWSKHDTDVNIELQTYSISSMMGAKLISSFICTARLPLTVNRQLRSCEHCTTFTHGRCSAAAD